MKIDQAGLPAGTAGRARTDGLGTGALVTLTSTGGGNTHRFELLWVPEDDTTAVASLAPTGTPSVWTFSPTALAYGTYRIRLVVDEGLATESETIRVFRVRDPATGIALPAPNERADPSASLVNAGSSVIGRSEDNEVEAPVFANGNWSGWYRVMRDVVNYIAGGSTSLQAAYALGNTVSVAAADGAIAFSNGTDATDVLQLSRTFAGAGRALDITMGATCTSDALRVRNSGNGSAIQVCDGSSPVIEVTGAGAVALTPTFNTDATIRALSAGNIVLDVQNGGGGAVIIRNFGSATSQTKIDTTKIQPNAAYTIKPGDVVGADGWTVLVQAGDGDNGGQLILRDGRTLLGGSDGGILVEAGDAVVIKGIGGTIDLHGIGAVTPTLQIQNPYIITEKGDNTLGTGVPAIQFVGSAAGIGIGGNQISLCGGGIAALVVDPALFTGTGAKVGTLIQPQVNQSGAGSYTALKVNVTELGTGSGSKLLLDLQLGGVSKASVDRAGLLQSVTAQVKTPAAGAFTDSDEVTLTAGVKTTDATVTTLATLALDDGAVYWVMARVVARGTAGVERAAYYKWACVYRQGGGAATQQGTTAAVTADIETTAGMDATIDVNGNNARVRVTGIAATTINWVCTLTYQRAKLDT